MINTKQDNKQDKIKELYEVVSFLQGVRTLTYGNLTDKQALQHIIRKSMQGQVCLIYPNDSTSELIKNNINDLDSYTRFAVYQAKYMTPCKTIPKNEEINVQTRKPLFIEQYKQNINQEVKI